MPDSKIYELCAFCPSLCMDRCPVVAATGRNTWTPQSKMMVAWLASRGHVPFSVENSGALYQCTGCLACTQACLHQIDVEQGLFKARASAVETGVVPWSMDRFIDVGTDLEQIFVDAVPSEYVVPEAMGVLFPGTAVLRTNPGVLKDVFKCFERLSIDTFAAIPSVAVDSGYDLYAAGFINDFKEYARQVAKNLRRYNAIMVLSPADYYAFTVIYPLYDIRLPDKITLAFEHVGNLVLARDIPRKVGGKIAYHDCCITGRHLEMFETPRRVIEHITGRPPIELRRHHKDSMCCGASGAWNITNPAGSTEAGGLIARMAVEAGAGILVSSSGKCAANIAGGAPGLKVMDILSLVAMAFGD